MEDIDVVFFDVKYKGEYLDYHDFWTFCIDRNLPIVPRIFVGFFVEEYLKSFTEGNSKIAPKQIREGCVVKSITEENNHRVGRKILKSINTEYLCSKNRTEFH